MKILDRDVPQSLREFNGHTARYIQVGRTSQRWSSSADWTSPTSLDFTTAMMDAKQMMAVVEVSGMESIHPNVLVEAAYLLVRKADNMLRASGRVMDRREYCGIDMNKDPRTWRLALTTVMKTWPAIEGVTVPVKDRTS
jgi:hypothetical protein